MFTHIPKMDAIVYRFLFVTAIVADMAVWANPNPKVNESESMINSTSVSVGLLNSGCYKLQSILEKQGDACRCYDMKDVDDEAVDKRDDVGSSSSSSSSSLLQKELMLSASGQTTTTTKRSSSLWIGCTRDRMPMIYRSLNAMPNDTRLSKLWIWDSLIPLIPPRFFFKIRAEKLILENNHVGELAPGVLTPMAGSLRSLILRNNIVKEVNRKMFADLNELRTLDLSGNLLTEFNVDSFGALKNLRLLNLHNNKARRLIGAPFGELTNLRHLNLARNELTSIEAGAFAGLTNLNTLSLEHNKIQRIAPGAFDELSNLKHLNLGSNLLTALALPVGAMSHLKHLYLHDNNFRSIKDISVDVDEPLFSLQTLHLDKNQVTALDSREFARFVNLRVLSLASNKITTLNSRSFEGLKNLTVLSLQDNQIDKIPNELFTTTPALERLFLSQNVLIDINDRALIGLYRLTVISMAHNRLQSISPKAFADLRSLKRLYLNDNFLSQLHENTTSTLASILYALDLSDNTWQCDCSLLWLSKWMAEHESVIINGNNTICQKRQQPVASFHQISEESCRNAKKSATVDGFDDGIFDAAAGGRTPTNAVWVTVVGVILGVVTVFILITIVALYVQDGGRWTFLKSDQQKLLLKRVPSDMVNLLPNELTIREK